MTKREQYGLRFYKITSPGDQDFLACNFNHSIDGSVGLGLLLESLSDTEPTNLLEEVISAINNAQYEEDYILDFNSSIWIEFLPPNARIHYMGGLHHYDIPLINFRLLLEEWIDFIQSP